MKQFVYIVVFILCGINVGCNDFLEEYSKDQVYAASCEDLDEVLIGNGYMENLYNSYNVARLPQCYYPYLFVMDDDVEELFTQSSSNYYDEDEFAAAFLRHFYTWQKNPFVKNNANLDQIEDITISKLYAHIAYVNTIINYVDEFPNDPIEDQKRIRGEGQFLRAAYYLMVSNLYGEAYDAKNGGKDISVPLKKVEWVVEDKFERATVHDVYEVIVNDLKNASENLEGVVQKNFYRTNQLAAYILLSRVYLYMEKYEEAVAQCNLAMKIGCPLKDLNTFKLTGDPKTRDYLYSESNPEIIFTMGSSVVDVLMSPYRLSFNANSYSPSLELMNLYKNEERVKDLRLSCYYQKHDKALDRYGVCKNTEYSKYGNAQKVFEAFLIRSVEVYLNKAEAQVMLGDLSGAITTLQPFLETRYAQGKLPELASLNQEEFVNFIRDERRRELSFEGHRWPDLRRYAVNSKYPLKKEIRHTVYTTSSITGGNYAGYYVLKPYGEDQGWILPYPDVEIEYNEGQLINPNRPDRFNEDINFREDD
ncbi:MAG TPA: RagB/SusD family nutrient uptake outer membrane protein [Candidatus Butyricimonas faecavium]|nr:RagB/SusD family nutrient uptake outer membrane protein [Candidatus Butyricimonas faecavium]